MKQLVFPSTRKPRGTKPQIINIPASVGHGKMVTTYCNSGIRVIISDYRFHQPVTVKTENSHSIFGFGFCLSGAIQVHPTWCKEGFIIHKGQSGFFSFPEQEGYVECITTQPLLRVNIFLSPELLLQLTGMEPEQMPSILTNNEQSPVRIAHETTPHMQTALNQIIHCTYQGLTKQLYIESKILELIAYKVAQLEFDPEHTVSKRKLTSDEIERIRYAASLLTHDLEHPPNIADLSHHVGMCRSKLYACFREVFGITPFGYLQQKRMETAGNLLKSGEVNVTQAAYTVGYSSLSHFTKAFKQHFGVTPSKCHKLVPISSRITL